LYYGAGAGAEPTGSAVVADLVDVTRMLTTDPNNRVPHLAFQPDSLQDIPILPIEAIETAYYLRICSYDRPGMLAKITGILSSNNISIEAIVQKEPKEGADQVSVVILTHRVVERDVNQAIQAIEQLDGITSKVMRIRLETLDK